MALKKGTPSTGKKTMMRKKAIPPGMDFTTRLERFLFSSKEKQSFLEDLATLIEDGLPATKAVAVIDEISEGATKKLTQSVLLKIGQGKNFVDGMVDWLPQAVIELIRAGEQGGTLSQNIRAAAETMGRQNEVIGVLISSLTYPTIVLCIGVGVLLYFGRTVLPQFETIKPISEWPEVGQQLVGLSSFIQSWWWIILIGMVGGVIVLSRYLQTATGAARQQVDSLPIVGIYRQVVGARFMETMGLLVNNGVIFKQALKILQRQANPYMMWHLMMMDRKLGRGESNIADVLDTGLLERSDVLRLRAIADSKGFEHALVRQGRQSAAAAVKSLTKICRILGAVMLAAGAGLAGLMVLGIYNIGSSLAN
jgi:type II secretory pathway component PulF